MFKSLYTKLAVALLGLFCLLGILIFISTQMALDMYRQEVVQKLNKDLAGKIVKEKLLGKDDTISEEGLQDVFDMLMVVNPIIEVYLLDPAGKVLAFSAPPGKVKLERVDLEPIRKWFAKDFVFPLTGDDPRNPGQEKIFSAARIPEQGPVRAYLYIILGGEIYDSIAEKLRGSYIVRLSGLWIMASLLFALVSGLLVFAYLTRRLKQLALVMDSPDLKQTAAGLQTVLRKDRQDDEIDRLALAFQQLLNRIDRQMKNIKNADTLRRTFIANVSHDLRTPLATLQGYIESLYSKNKALSQEERTHHLRIAMKHVKRLGKLVDELFELAKLDSQEVKLHPEPFNIQELAQDVIQKFDLIAARRGVSIHIDTYKSLPFAYGDIGLIERAIENLLENGLRHTPQGGSVRLSFDQQNGDIAVSIEDTGSGIAKEDLPYIFKRFYQPKSPHKKGHGHSGLGLAITKRILELHGKSIKVKSMAGSGTTFTFYLSAHNPT